jgi:hypothetical protein
MWGKRGGVYQMGYAGHGRFNMLESAMLNTRWLNMLNELCRAEGTYIAEM